MTAVLSAPYDATMPRRHLRLLALLAALVIALITSCDSGQGADLPDGARLLADSATAMRTVTSARFNVDVQGNAPEIPFQSAQGQLTRQGSVKGTVNRNQGGQIVELEVVVVDEQLYLRGATGPFLKLPASNLSGIYDPRLILDPDRGIAAVLASATDASTEAREQAAGVDSYRVEANFPAQPLGALLPGPQDEPKTGTVWIAAQDFRLVQARFPASDGTITVRFSEYDAPAEITAPA
ncbi:MAG TPA: LppX_LprAFG lipoprotein [Pseudonocardiaceae bacterium]|nr:LppX_LprAFG lipoprotein [Pseudonocardiaceae bacterium]